MQPSFLPDGNHFLYLAWSNQQASRAIYVGSLESDRDRQALRLTIQSRVRRTGLPAVPAGGRALGAAVRRKEVALTGAVVRIADEIAYDLLERRSRLRGL